MSGQATIVLPTVGTVSGLTMAQDINAALAALVGKNGGASQPANAGAAGNTQEAWMDWADTTNLLWKLRGTDNLGWSTLGAQGAGASPLWQPAALGKFLSPYDSGFRNRVINGDMRIDQANAGASVVVNSGNEFYGPDMVSCGGTASAGVITMTKTATSAFAGFAFMTRFQATTADASPAAGATYRGRIPIEGQNLIDFNLGTASAIPFTLSFFVRSSLSGQFSGAFRNAATNRSYPFTFTINSANTVEQKVVTLTGDTTGTWATDNTVGMDVIFDLGGGSTFRSTAGSWQAGNFHGVTGAVRLISTLNATLDITGVSVEAGSYTAATVPPFEVRGFEEELARCQRYFAKTFQLASVPAQAAGQGGALAGSATVAVQPSVAWRYPVEMRTTPTITTYSPSTADANWRDIGNVTSNTVRVGTATTAGVVIDATTANANNVYLIHATANARL